MANTDLRRLMQLKKATSNKITHPLAKYNNLGQLLCVICTKVIKDEAVWNAHLQSKKHKESVLLLKSKSTTAVATTSSSSKISHSKDISNKNSKSKLPSDFFDQKGSVTSSAKHNRTPMINNGKPKSILKGSQDYLKQNGIDTKPQSINVMKSASSTSVANIPSDSSSLTGNIQSTDAMEVEVAENNGIAEATSSHRKRKMNANLPQDFFDEPKKEKKEKTDAEVPLSVKKMNNGSVAAESQLPEGFFDDPKKDAEARNVEYKDPKEKEWEMFQKMIEEETRVAETIQEEEDEEAEMQKDMTEFNKLKSCLSRVEHLKSLVKQEKQKQNETVKTKAGNEESGESDEDIDDIMFNWRAKMF